MSRVDGSLDQSKKIAPAISSNTRDFLFVVLTCVAGSVDALSVFGLGGVFTSLLSGNTIVLAAYLVQGHSTKALLGIFAFVGYIPGAALAALFLKQEKHNTEWTKRVTQTLGIEAIFLMVLVVGTYFSHNYSSFNVYLVFLAALSMGIQYTCAKQSKSIE
ncbi:MAG: YoaK family protein [Candidatus Nitrosopolaris sp.]